MNIIIFLLICYGATNNLIYGSIFEGFRNFLHKFGSGDYSLYKLFTCFMCLGTWMGFFICIILKLTCSDLLLFNTTNLLVTIFLHGLLSGGGVWLIHTMQEAIEK